MRKERYTWIKDSDGYYFDSDRFRYRIEYIVKYHNSIRNINCIEYSISGYNYNKSFYSTIAQTTSTCKTIEEAKKDILTWISNFFNEENEFLNNFKKINPIKEKLI